MKLRRQHWCCLLIVMCALCIGIGLYLSSMDAGVDDRAVVARLLREVPLIDG